MATVGQGMAGQDRQMNDESFVGSLSPVSYIGTPHLLIPYHTIPYHRESGNNSRARQRANDD